MANNKQHSCPPTKLEGLQQLYSADDVAIQWLKTRGSWMHTTTTTAELSIVGKAVNFSWPKIGEFAVYSP